MKYVIILLGPTGVGKTEIALSLAGLLDTEIIGADSMQIYRHMDIGTAKPTREERASIVHHMIDIIEPSETFSAGRYIEEAAPIIDRMHAAGKIPIIAGGTGLYIEALCKGLFSGATADWELREQLASYEYHAEGYLYDYLSKIDSLAASRIKPNDTRRIIRAIEVYLNNGDAISTLQEYKTLPPTYNFIKLGLNRNRTELYNLIDKRVDMMITDGLIDEVSNLMTLSPSKTPMQAIGYKELVSYLNGQSTLDDAINLIKQSSRRYAKRQMTWFNRYNDIYWLDITAKKPYERVLECIKQKFFY